MFKVIKYVTCEWLNVVLRVVKSDIDWRKSGEKFWLFDDSGSFEFICVWT